MSKFHSVELVSKVLKNPDYAESFTWENFLCGLNFEENEFDSKLANDIAVPLSTFREHVLREYVEHLTNTPDMILYVRLKDFKHIVDPRFRLCWPAVIKKFVGYRVLMRWLGATEKDKEYDFWINLGSADVRGRLIKEEENEAYLPPEFLLERWRSNDFENCCKTALQDAYKYHTASGKFLDAKEKITFSCKLRVGQRLELLDNNVSTRVRPARIKTICGRRVQVQVLKIDCDVQDEENERQFGPHSEFWVDQASFFLFPVGWACLNNYNLEAKSDYRRHAESIAQSILGNRQPEYSSIDVTPDQLAEWKRVPHCNSKWEAGMKLELMDPLSNTFRDLSVASVLEILRDGYLRIGIDGPDSEEECIPLHCTSPLLFPCGYAKKHKLVLQTPEDDDNFEWDSYLKLTKSKAAPVNFFKSDPTSQRRQEFKEGAKLEASDMCENLLVCPGTVVGVKGRLVMVNFDGWVQEFDQYFDIDSKDIFPLGWCEIHGFKLEHPKDDVINEPQKKKNKK